jgi:CBS domain-containing protein
LFFHACIADKKHMTLVSDIMKSDVFCITMDLTLGAAMEICSRNKIRHLPIVNENGELIGLVTDRDLRFSISPRIGTISENSADRESVKRPVHLIMARELITTNPEMPVAEAAGLMLANRVGCLPVLDPERRVIGLVTATDMLRYIASDAAQ